jgi:hypothetical protein
MATKAKTPDDEKLSNQDLNIIEVLEALDKKDYGYYDRLSEEQKKKFVPFLIVKWMSAVSNRDPEIQGYYVRATNIAANKYLFNENVSKHPKLQWLMLCSVSPGIGKQYHKWIPQIKERVALLKDNAVAKDMREYYTKIYPKANKLDIDEVAQTFVDEQKKKVYLSKLYPDLKLSDVELLSKLITDADIKQYEKDSGN